MCQETIFAMSALNPYDYLCNILCQLFFNLKVILFKLRMNVPHFKKRIEFLSIY